jgi:hypothetical protein
MLPEKDVLSVNDHEAVITLVPEGRSINFKKQCLESIDIWRSVNDNEWLEIAKDVRAPYVDDEKIDSPAVLKYKVLFNGKEGEYKTIEVHLP